jgi:hypothetical protein
MYCVANVGFLYCTFNVAVTPILFGSAKNAYTLYQYVHWVGRRERRTVRPKASSRIVANSPPWTTPSCPHSPPPT